jgi:hypothetical protein
MSDGDSSQVVTLFAEREPVSCRVETQGGTVYWISDPDPNGMRWVVREHLQSSETNTMVLQKFSNTKERLDLGDKFRCRLGGDIQQGMPFVLDVTDHETRILSEPVVAIEVGNIPEMIFR